MNRRTLFASLLAILVLRAIPVSGQTTQFTHHGDIGFAANGNGYDIQLKLFDTPTVGTGTQQGADYLQLGVQMTDGEFTVQPDFGAALFTGAELYLETGWRVSGGGAFTVLPSRERITSVFANRSLSAAIADNATQLGGIPSTSFIQDTTSPQPGVSFNIGGSGTVGATLSAATVDAGTQYNIAGRRVFTVNGPFNDGANYNASNTFVGDSSGLNTSPTSLATLLGKANSFFGAGAGQSNTNGHYNSYFGFRAGQASDGSSNAFFGAYSGFSNTLGSANSFFGVGAGSSNTTGQQNAFFGEAAGSGNVNGKNNSFFGFFAGPQSNGEANSFFGHEAGYLNTSGENNSFFGINGGRANSTGSINSFFGLNAGSLNVAGNNNTGFGGNADFTAANNTGNNNTLLGAASKATTNLSNQTAIGANAFVGQSNSLVLGSINGVNGATADTKVGIGITTPAYRLHVIDPLSGGLRVQTNSAGGLVASFGGNGDFMIDAPYISGGRLTVKEDGSIGIGIARPQDKLDVIGVIRVSQLGSGGSQTLCRNPSNQISTCSSSLRYKTNVAPFSGSLDLLRRLRPITFNWKADGEADFGLAAEEVATVEPLLVTHNRSGQIEGVKYDRVGVVLINAVKEQQTQLEQYRSQLSQQQAEIAALKRLLCAGQPDAELCKESPPPARKSIPGLEPIHILFPH